MIEKCFILFLFLTFLFIFKDGDTPLHMAAFHGFEEIVKIFIEHGANVNIQNKVFFLIFCFIIFFFIVDFVICGLLKRVSSFFFLIFFSFFLLGWSNST